MLRDDSDRDADHTLRIELFWHDSLNCSNADGRALRWEQVKQSGCKKPGLKRGFEHFVR